MPALVVVLLMGMIMFVDASPVVGLLLPGDLLVVAVVASNHPRLAVLIVAGVVLGTMASWSLFFHLGSHLGPRLRRGRVGRWIGPKRWDTAERLLNGRGARTLTLVQFLPVLNAVVPMVAGGLGMHYRQFVRFAAPGTMLWGTVFGAGGIAAGLASTSVFGESASPFGALLFASPGFLAGWVIIAFLRRELHSAGSTVLSPPSPPSLPSA